MLKNQTEPIGHYKNLADVKISKISGLCTSADMQTLGYTCNDRKISRIFLGSCPNFPLIYINSSFYPCFYFCLNNLFSWRTSCLTKLTSKSCDSNSKRTKRIGRHKNRCYEWSLRLINIAIGSFGDISSSSAIQCRLVDAYLNFCDCQSWN